MKAGRIVLIVIGALLALLGFGLLAGGAGALVGYATQRDDDGFFRTPEVRLATPTYAIVSDRIDLETRPGPSDWLIDRGGLGTVKLVVEPAEETPVFAGIGPSAEVAAYLGDVSRDQIRDIDLNPDRVRYRRREGDAVPAPPGEQSFWVATSSGSDTSDLTWEVESGDWTVVRHERRRQPGRRHGRAPRHQGRLVPPGHHRAARRRSRPAARRHGAGHHRRSRPGPRPGRAGDRDRARSVPAPSGPGRGRGDRSGSRRPRGRRRAVAGAALPADASPATSTTSSAAGSGW